MTKNDRLQLRIDEELKQWFHAWAQSKGMKMSEYLIRHLQRLREESQKEQDCAE